MPVKKSSFGTVAAIVLIVAAFAAMAVFAVYLFGSGGTEPSTSEAASGSAPEFSVEESSEPEEVSAELKATLAEAEVGNLVRFGTGSGEGDPSPVEWIVLDKRDGELLLISHYCFGAYPFDVSRESGSGSFSESGLAKYLNGDFIDSVFNETERGYILGDDGSKVSILSAAEAEEYLAPQSHRVARTEPGAKPVEWWLSDVTGSGFAAYVFTDGSVRTKGYAFDYTECYFRPVILVSTDAEAE